MLRSLYSGVAGLMVHRTQMDVIGNNIANVNTTAYKTARANFQDVLYQTIRPGGAGRNYAQVGTGVSVAGISTDFTQGMLQATGRTLDLAIQGEGLFVLSADARLYTADDGAGNVNNIDCNLVTTDPANEAYTTRKFTRGGVFFIDKDGYIVNSNGYRLLGEVYDGNDNNKNREALRIITRYNDGARDIELRIATLSIGPDGKITGKYTNGVDIKFYHNDATTTGTPPIPNNAFWKAAPTEARILIATFPNKEGLKKVGQNLYKEDENVSGKAKYEFADGSIISIASGYLEMSNVDLANEFVEMIKTQRGFQANARTITVSDTLLEELVNLKR